MTKELWINLPVKNVKAAREFYTKIGFTLNTRFPETGQSASLFAGEKNVVIMLFTEQVFKGFSSNEVTDAQQSNEVLFSIDAESREEVDELAEKVSTAGGTLYARPGESEGWMYGMGFADLDGHRWSALYMDYSKMPQQ
jgi:predicted lactoylglutathione lyase